MTRLRSLRAFFSALLLASCAPEPVPADPAIWLVENAEGQKAWLFGTIHALEKPALWQTAEVADALLQADTLMVEVAGLEDQAAMARTFAKLAHTPGLPLLTERVAPEVRAPLLRLLDKHGLKDNGFSSIETWAVALTLARAETSDANSEYGIDRAVVAQAKGKRIVELEGAEGQLRLFDGLPMPEQRDLLTAIVADTGVLDRETASLAQAWHSGDMAAIEMETSRGLLADPELRAVLFTSRNQRWSEAVTRELAAGKHPFVAVGAAHMAGPDGLPALFVAEGYSVTRLR
ncbi:MAG: TraB/GumN family protein [Novosphingobium sp.]|nr:TraB/GumN family protein [Novosphingobium sp.]